MDQLQLILKGRPKTDDCDLLAEARHAASSKARERGWIVWGLSASRAELGTMTIVLIILVVLLVGSAIFGFRG
jgi:hypothetical protein